MQRRAGSCLAPRPHTPCAHRPQHLPLRQRWHGDDTLTHVEPHHDAPHRDQPSGWVAGVDGCPAGWLVVLRPLHDASAAVLRLAHGFDEVLRMEPRPDIVAVDMPIGLAAIGGIGGRQADIEARANLGQRQSAVFAVPSRAAVMETDYRRSCQVALATSAPPRKVSKQCFNLFPKIRQIDALMTPELQTRVYEAHPELGFWALNGGVPLSEPKKLKSRPHEPGLAIRRNLLESAGYRPALLHPPPGLRRAAATADDLLDACACSWTAARIARGQGRRFPTDPPCDERGLRMEIWC